MMKVFCERLRELRKEKNLSTTQVGKSIGVSHATISRWENGLVSPPIEHLYSLAIFFGVSSDYLLGIEN